MKVKIFENKIKCNHCGDILISEFRHDFKTCSCGTVSIDGGKDYLKRSFKNSVNDLEDLSSYEIIADEGEDNDGSVL